MFKFKAMDKFIFYFTLLVVVCNKGLQCKYFEDKKTDETRIVGGNETTIEMYPYQAYLLVFDGTNYYQCGGSIISKHYIVTAAHCLQGMKNIFVRIGSTNSNYGGSLYQSTSFYSHLLYSNRTHDYDVGIVKIEAGMKLDGTKAKAIELVDVGYDPKENVSMVITGWGTTEESGSISTTLRVTQVPVASRSQCKKKFKNLTSRMFCAGFLNGGKDSCQGDSGGPAVSISGNKLAGITSHGIGCARPNIPGVYTLLGNLEVRTFIRNITLL